jgi:hypothetical protein
MLVAKWLAAARANKPRVRVRVRPFTIQLAASFPSRVFRYRLANSSNLYGTPLNVGTNSLDPDPRGIASDKINERCMGRSI